MNENIPDSQTPDSPLIPTLGARTIDRHDALLALALAVLSLFTFGAVLRNGFVNLDDNAYITENPHVNTGLSFENAEWAFTAVHSANWHPLTWLSHQLDCQSYGLNAAGHHATSIVLHAANTVLLLLFLRLATGVRWSCAAVALLFAVHPLRVESVAWISERKDVLSAFFGLLALIAYVRYTRRPAYWPHIAVSVALACSLLAKPALVTLPCLFLLLDFWPLRRIHVSRGYRAFAVSAVRATVEKLPFFVLSAAVATLTILAQRSSGAVAALDVYPWQVRAGNAVISYAAYLGKLIWPASLAVPYPLHADDISTGKVAFAGGLLFLITALTFWQSRRRPVLFVGWFWYLGTLVPMIGLVQVGSQAMADRYTYITQIGVLWAAVWAASTVFAAARQRQWCARGVWRARLLGMLPILVTVALAGMCAMLTQRQVAVWRDSETLFRHALANTRDNSIAHNNLGRHLLERYIEQRQYNQPGELGNVDVDEPLLNEAVSHIQASLRIAPGNLEARSNHGVAMLLGNHIGAAIREFQRIEGTPAADAAFYVNFAAAMKLAGKREEAGAMLRRALELEPGFPKALRLLEQLQPKTRLP